VNSNSYDGIVHSACRFEKDGVLSQSEHDAMEIMTGKQYWGCNNRKELTIGIKSYRIMVK
jgi:hypothetical protein